MKIAVDAGALGITDKRLKVGVYEISLNLLNELLRIDKKNIYYLFSFDSIKFNNEILTSRVVNKIITPRLGWFSFRLPMELAINKNDLFLGLSQAIPATSTPSIGFVYDLSFLLYPEAYVKSRERLQKNTETLVKRADHLITISNSVRRDLLLRYSILAKSHITVATPGINHIFNMDGLRYHSKYPYFLFVGALKPGKNVPLILRSFSEFIKTQKKIFDLYLVGGDYWKDPQIDILIKELHLDDRVKQLGHVPVSDLAAYYRGAVAFVSPSFYEGFCLPAVEAMASGCPVIGSTTGAFPEVVGDSGILVDPQDVQGLTEAMMTMVNNEKARREYIKKGLARSKRYSWRKFAEKVYEIIKRYE